MEQNKLQDLKSRLKESPLFNLSLCSKELFHSNFIAWLVENSKDFQRSFLRYLKYNDADFDLSKTTVFREKEKIDIWIQFTKQDNNKLDIIIENKVKCLPKESQLREYQKKYKSLNKKDGNDVKYVLLSLAEPFFTLNDWQYMSYRDICSNVLKDIHFDNTYYYALLEDYRQFICTLQQISDLLTGYYEKVKLSDDNVKDLFKEIRMHDFYEKRKYDYIASKLCTENSGFIFGVNPTNLELNKIIKGNIYVSTNYFHEQGLINIMKCVEKNNKNCVIIGIQIQAGNVRKIVQVCNGNAIDKLVDYGNWWNDTDNVGKSELPDNLKGNTWYPGNYGKFKDSFVYRLLTCQDDVTLLDVCKNCANLVKEFSKIQNNANTD